MEKTAKRRRSRWASIVCVTPPNVKRRTARFIRRHPLSDVVVDGLSDMGGDFGPQLVFTAGTRQETAKAREKDSQRRHDRPP